MLCSLVVLLFVDRNPMATGLGARSTGRLDFCMLLLKFSMSFAFNAVINSIPPIVLQCYMLCGGVCWLWMQLSVQPFVHSQMNECVCITTSHALI